MVSGPLRFFSEASPTSMRPMVRSVSTETSQVFTTPCHSPWNTPYRTVTISGAAPT